MDDMKKGRILDYLKENVDVISQLVSECNGWDGSLEEYYYYENDEEFFNMFFADKPMEVARAIYFGDYNYNDDYVTFNGYGNLKSIDRYEMTNELEHDAEYIFDTWFELYEQNKVDTYDDELKELLES